MHQLRVAELKNLELSVQIRAAARKGVSPANIASRQRLSISVVERVLTSADHPRLSDPVHLFRTRREEPGKAPGHVQAYWAGFMTAAGRIWGYGASFTLVVTLGEDLGIIESFVADVGTDRAKYELCRSSTAGWQAYIRDRRLCEALLAWGVPLASYKGDPTVLDDLPEEFAGPFLRGYVDGDRASGRSADAHGGHGFVLQGPPLVLAGINSVVQRFWEVPGGAMSSRATEGELRFSDPHACEVIYGRLSAHASRVPTEGPERTEG